MMERLIEHLIERGEALAKKRTERAREQVKNALEQEFGDQASVKEQGDVIAVETRNLEQKLIDNSDLRDVGFLMRGISNAGAS